MPYKIAVASSDGKVINQHFGRSRRFLIFSVADDGKYEFEELRESEPPCGLGEHNENIMEQAAEKLSDCRIILVSQIGPGAEQALRLKGIQAFSVSDYIDRALEKIIKFESKKINKQNN